jgi:hypothetical protein
VSNLSYNGFGTGTVKSSGFSLQPTTPRESIGLSIAVVKTIDGWVGQVQVICRIAWESRPYKTAAKARDKALAHVLEVLA